MANTGITPVVDADRRFNIWLMNDVYTDEINSTGRYVPNVDDLVVGYDSGWWRCTHSDIQTGYSTLVPWSFTNITDNTDTTDTVVGGTSTTDDSYRVYVNTDVVPYAFSFDTRLKIYGSDASYLKVFRDNKTSGSSISAVFNSAGGMVSENIELESVVIPNTVVTAIKVPKLGHLTDKVENGEVINAVIYSNSGAVLAIFKVVVVVTNFVRTINVGKKLITNISLVSPYISASDDRQLLYPANMTVDSSYLVGRVTYNDGSTEHYPVDGRKFKLMGINNYVTSQVGQTVPVVLNYNLASDEYGNNVNEVGNTRFMNKSYTLKTVDSDNMYSVKLFVVPYWVKADNVWALDYYLYNLDRGRTYKVTELVEYSVNSKVFHGDSARWGVAQNITISLNLDKLGTQFKYYRHVQEFTITLHQAGSNTNVSGYYTLEYDGNSVFSQITYAKLTSVAGNGASLDFSNGHSIPDMWLESIYYSTEPLHFPFVEEVAPKPTHVKINIGREWSREVTIEDMLHPINNITAPLEQGTPIQLEFIGNYNSVRMHLATVGLSAKEI